MAESIARCSVYRTSAKDVETHLAASLGRVVCLDCAARVAGVRRRGPCHVCDIFLIALDVTGRVFWVADNVDSRERLSSLMATEAEEGETAPRLVAVVASLVRGAGTLAVLPRPLRSAVWRRSRLVVWRRSRPSLLACAGGRGWLVTWRGRLAGRRCRRD